MKKNIKKKTTTTTTKTKEKREKREDLFQYHSLYEFILLKLLR